MNFNFYAHNERKICTESNDGLFLFLFFSHIHIQIQSHSFRHYICVCVCTVVADSVVVVTRMMLLLGDAALIHMQYSSLVVSLLTMAALRQAYGHAHLTAICRYKSYCRRKNEHFSHVARKTHAAPNQNEMNKNQRIRKVFVGFA